MVKECLQYIVGLSPAFEKKIPEHFTITDARTVRLFLKTRNTFSNKGDYGTGGLVAGSKGMMGAAALCARAFMRSGGGKLTCHVPEACSTIIQTLAPEAMAKIEPGDAHLESVSGIEKYDVIGIGPGIGSYESNEQLLDNLLSAFRKPVVIDADGLNTLSKNKLLLAEIPEGSVITPHPKEFERLFGETATELDKINLALAKAAELNIVIVVKGPFTLVATPTGKANFNTTGNPGMATGGTGDVLTGMITGLIAQQYTAEQAAILGVYLHGLSGDLAAAELSQEALIAGDLIDFMGKAFKTLR